MRLLQASRKKVRAGDIFTLTLDEKNYYFGRVIYEKITFGGLMIKGHEIPGWPNCVFAYIYAISSMDLYNIPELSKDDLLIAPFATNHQGWLRGYFMTVGNRPIGEDDFLKKYCFYDSARDCYRDIEGKLLKERFDPCGHYALDSYRTIDDSISEALGVDFSSR